MVVVNLRCTGHRFQFTGGNQEKSYKIIPLQFEDTHRKTNAYLYLRIGIIFHNIFQRSPNWHIVEFAFVSCLQFQSDKHQQEK